MNDMTGYASIGMVVALAKSIAKKYESVGIVDVSTSASGDRLIFTLANGTTHSVTLNFAAKGVTYDDTTTHLNVSNVQTAIEAIYNRGLQSVTSLNLTVGQEDIIYDTEDGITVSASATIGFANGQTVTFDSQYNLPVIAGSGISIDANQEGTKATIKAVAEYITITAPATATSGTLTQEQLTKLQSSDNVFIAFDNEYYRLQSSGHLAGFLTYSMAEYENNIVTIKSITVTISTLGWVLNTQTVSAVTEVTLSGTSGTLTNEQMALVNGNKVIFVKDGKQYRLNQTAQNWKSYTNIIYPTSVTQEISSIYVNIAVGALNYATWSYEVETPTQPVVGDVYTDNIISETLVGGSGVELASLNTTDNYWHLANSKFDDTIYAGTDLIISGMENIKDEDGDSIFWHGTQTEYDALATHKAGSLYIIVPDEE